jgi:hypothetical protein
LKGLTGDLLAIGRPATIGKVQHRPDGTELVHERPFVCWVQWHGNPYRGTAFSGQHSHRGTDGFNETGHSMTVFDS